MQSSVVQTALFLIPLLLLIIFVDYVAMQEDEHSEKKDIQEKVYRTVSANEPTQKSSNPFTVSFAKPQVQVYDYDQEKLKFSNQFTTFD